MMQYIQLQKQNVLTVVKPFNFFLFNRMNYLQDISNYKNHSDWLPIVASVLLIEVYVIFRTMYSKSTGQLMYRWYLDFGLVAVLSDVLILLIGFIIVRYLYKLYIFPKFGFNPALFIAILLGIQIIHDLAYYFLIVQQVPRGANTLIDFMKDYGKDYKASAIIGDSLIFIFCTLLAMILKGYSPEISIATIIISLYLIQYSLTTRRQ